MYKAAICAIVKNEHDYLLEWISYHRVIGVDYFLIYNNCDEEDDGTTRLLNKLEAIGVVHVIAWPDQGEWHLPSDIYLRPQIPAYYDGIERLRNQAEWVAFIDVDEFILPMREPDLPSTLALYRQYGAIGMNWKMFGSSGEKFKQDIPVCKRFIRASSQLCRANFHVKSIARPELIRDLNVHRPFLKKDMFVDEHGREITDPLGLHDSVSYDILRVNHYYTKSRQEWMQKAARGRADHPQKRLEESFRDTDFNDESDTFILKFYDSIIRGMRELARAANIESYPGLGAAAPRSTSRNARRLYARAGQPSFLQSSKTDQNSRSSGAINSQSKTLPVIDIRQRGNLGSRMIQYMVAQRIGAEAGECAISNLSLPEWGIVHPRLPGAPGEALEDPKTGHNVDIARVARLLFLGVKPRLSLVSGGQWLSNFPDLEFCRNLFPAEEQEYPGYGPEYLVCHIEFPEDRDWHGVLLPADFYAELAESTGLRLVFLGQREDNAYWQLLRKRFPDANFPSSSGPKADFQILRNSRYLVPGVDVSSWLAAWLSHAERIELAVSGLFHPVQEPRVNLLPLQDERYRFHLFPINYAVSTDRFEEAHAALTGSWRVIDREQLFALRSPRRIRRIESFLPFFDEEYYLQAYPDIAAAVRSDGLKSGFEHYTGIGFREGRGGFEFDIRWYSVAYPVAAREVGEGEYVDLLHHYVETGAARGYHARPEVKTNHNVTSRM